MNRRGRLYILADALKNVFFYPLVKFKCYLFLHFTGQALLAFLALTECQSERNLLPCISNAVLILRTSLIAYLLIPLKAGLILAESSPFQGLVYILL